MNNIRLSWIAATVANFSAIICGIISLGQTSQLGLLVGSAVITIALSLCFIVESHNNNYNKVISFLLMLGSIPNLLIACHLATMLITSNFTVETPTETIAEFNQAITDAYMILVMFTIVFLGYGAAGLFRLLEYPRTKS